MKTADVLNGAADLIEQRGHARGVFQDLRGCACLAGAISLTLSGGSSWDPQLHNPDYRLAMAALLGEIGIEVGDTSMPTIGEAEHHVFDFNDDVIEDQAHAAAVLRGAAKTMEVRG